VLRGLTESTRRTLLLRDESDAADQVFISIVVTNANPSTQELTARLGFRLAGALVDYVTFIWAELIVAASAVIIVWTWLLRSRAKS
jgi:hypothetical protein